MQKTEELFAVLIRWVSPRFGTYPSSNKCLSLAPEVTDGQSYVECQLDDGEEAYFFTTREQATTFKQRVDSFYRQSPQYFVIDDDQNVVTDESGASVVAWTPEVSIDKRVLDKE